MTNDERILDEQLFQYQGMSYEERNFYLNDIIKNCKEISNTVNIVDNNSTCQIVEMRFKKNNDEVYFNGSLSIGSENRSVSGIIYEETDSILVDMHITRLCVECDIKEYTVSDEFKIINGNVLRSSLYNASYENTYEIVENDEVKGKLLCK